MFSMQVRQIIKLNQIFGQMSRKSSILSRKNLLPMLKRSIFNVETAEDFEKKVKKSDKPVVIDFFASWCTPCKALAPRIENIVCEKHGEIKLAKVDIDEHSDLALDYDVGSVPALLVMHEGKVLNRMVGLQETDVIREWIDNVVSEDRKDRKRKLQRAIEEEDDD